MHYDVNGNLKFYRDGNTLLFQFQTYISPRKRTLNGKILNMKAWLPATEKLLHSFAVIRTTAAKIP